MGLFSRLAGTITTFFQIGGPNGPGFNDNAGALEARDAANAAFVVMRGATPVAANDLTTKAYVDALSPAGTVLAIDFAIGTGATQDSATSIPANAVVLRCQVTITTPYSAAGTISVGQVGNATLLQATTDNSPGTNGQYDAPQRTAWGVATTPVQVTVGGAPVAGVGFCTVEYSLPNP